LIEPGLAAEVHLPHSLCLEMRANQFSERAAPPVAVAVRRSDAGLFGELIAWLEHGLFLELFIFSSSLCLTLARKLADSFDPHRAAAQVAQAVSLRRNLAQANRLRYIQSKTTLASAASQKRYQRRHPDKAR